MPSPHEELCRLLGSPLPTQTMEGSEGAMAISPIVDTASLSKTGSHVVPLLVLFQTPPEATPTNTMLGFDSTTAKSSMRPPITAGPSSRNLSPLNLSADDEEAGAPGVSGAAITRAAEAMKPSENAASTAKLRSFGDVNGSSGKLRIIPLLSHMLHLLFRACEEWRLLQFQQ